MPCASMIRRRGCCSSVVVVHVCSVSMANQTNYSSRSPTVSSPFSSLPATIASRLISNPGGEDCKSTPYKARKHKNKKRKRCLSRTRSTFITSLPSSPKRTLSAVSPTLPNARSWIMHATRTRFSAQTLDAILMFYEQRWDSPRWWYQSPVGKRLLSFRPPRYR